MTKFLLLLSAAWAAHTSLFQFQDQAGYEKCLSTESIEDVFMDGTHAEKRWVHGMELKERCVKQAISLADKQKDAAQLLEWVDLTRRMAGPQLALPLAQKLVKLKLSDCNDMKVYDLLLKTLQNPATTKIAKTDFEEARKLVGLCLKDKQFKSDFVEEQSNADANIKTNACQILRDAGVVKKCGESK